MCVEVLLRGRLGNNLFQYALGRVIAERHGLALQCTRNWQVAGAGIPTLRLEDVACRFNDAPLTLPGRHITAPVEEYHASPRQFVAALRAGSADGIWDGQTIDLPAMLVNDAPRRIVLDGYFQRAEYYAPYRDRIRQWFRFEPAPISFKIDDDDVLVNVRDGDDFKRLGWTLPLSFYDDVLSRIENRGRVYVCGVGMLQGTRDALAKYRPTYFEGTPFEHFSAFGRFRRIVLSNSTFAWWAAYLSDAEHVYAPKTTQPAQFSFSGFRGVDLHMREARYIEVPVA